VTPAYSLLLASILATAWSCRESVPDPNRSEAAALIAIGERLYTAERYDSALKVFTRAIRLSERDQDEVQRSRALTWAGLVTGRLGEPGKALQHGSEALRIKQRLGLERDLAFSHHSIGLALLDLDRNVEAKRSFQQALEAATKAQDRTFIAKAHGGLGLVNSYLGDLSAARHHQQKSRAAARSIGDQRLEANALANIAMIHIYQGDAIPAIALLDTARALYKSANFGAGEQNALGQLATAYELTGREDLALSALDSSLRLSRQLGLREQEADLLRLIGGVHLRLGNYREALNTFVIAASMMRASNLDANLGSVMRSEAEARLRLGDVMRAKRIIADAIAHHLRNSEPLERLDDLLLASEIEYRAKGLSSAYGFIREARSLADTIHTRGSRMSVIFAEAHLADLAKDSRRVLNVLEQANPDLATGDLGVEWVSNALRARAYLRLDMLDSAHTAGTRAVTAVDRLRGQLVSEALRSTYVADRSDVYGDLVLTLLRMGREDEAFRIADAARSHNLVDRLSATRDSAALSRISPQLAEQERLLKRIDELVQQLRATDRSGTQERSRKSEVAEQSVEVELTKARAEYEAVAARSAQTHGGANSILGGAAVRLQDVRSSLQDDEALVEYLLTGDRLLTFVLTRDTLRVMSSAINGNALLQRVRLLSDLWGQNTPQWQLGVPASRELFKVLVQPVTADRILRNKRRLVIIPHGVIGEVPFPALIDGGTGRFLIQDHDLLEMPSAATFAALRTGVHGGRSTDHRGIGFAPFNAVDQLPATEAEVVAFRSAGPDRQSVLGKNATESALRAALGRNMIVHVATHGVMNLQSPLFSRIEMAGVRNEGPDDNGRLELYEVLSLPVRSSLVFLSGCETGAGLEWLNDPVRGTADLTLAQAFLAAGAANVITTLWRIPDKGAARFARVFYSLLGSRHLAGAFSATQRAMLTDSLYRSPYYWAGYVLAGEGNFRLRPQKGRPASVPLTSAPNSNVVPTVRYAP
jgi:CHAT domain-containing protein